MAKLLAGAGLSMPLEPGELHAPAKRPSLIERDGSILLGAEAKSADHLKQEEFADKTGFEAFVNHFHFACDGTRNGLLNCLGVAASLQQALLERSRNREFRIILAINDGECTVRFHQLRRDEHWLQENTLNDYIDEAILVFDTGDVLVKEHSQAHAWASPTIKQH